MSEDWKRSVVLTEEGGRLCLPYLKPDGPLWPKPVTVTFKCSYKDTVRDWIKSKGLAVPQWGNLYLPDMHYIGTCADGVYYDNDECDFTVMGAIADPSTVQHTLLEYAVARGTKAQCKAYADWRNRELGREVLRVVHFHWMSTPPYKMAQIRTTPIIGYLIKKHHELADDLRV